MIIFHRALIACLGFSIVLGCGDSHPPQEITAVHGSDADEPAVVVQSVPASAGFSWIVPGELAAMPLPGRNQPLEEDAAFLEQEGIRILVSLTEEPPDGDTLSAHSIEQRHIPVDDYSPPTLTQMDEFVTLVENAVDSGRPVVVHCTAGLGRSGTMAAAYLVSTGVSADEAISTIRSLRPGSIETAAQEEAVRRYEED